MRAIVVCHRAMDIALVIIATEGLVGIDRLSGPGTSDPASGRIHEPEDTVSDHLVIEDSNPGAKMLVPKDVLSMSAEFSVSTVIGVHCTYPGADAKAVLLVLEDIRRSILGARRVFGPFLAVPESVLCLVCDLRLVDASNLETERVLRCSEEKDIVGAIPCSGQSKLAIIGLVFIPQSNSFSRDDWTNIIYCNLGECGVEEFLGVWNDGNVEHIGHCISAGATAGRDDVCIWPNGISVVYFIFFASLPINGCLTRCEWPHLFDPGVVSDANICDVHAVLKEKAISMELLCQLHSMLTSPAIAIELDVKGKKPKSARAWVLDVVVSAKLMMCLPSIVPPPPPSLRIVHGKFDVMFSTEVEPVITGAGTVAR